MTDSERVLAELGSGPDYIKKVEVWLNRKWPVQACQVCREESWSIGEVVSLEAVNKGESPNGYIYPVFLVTCCNCGYSLVFSAIAAGIIPPDQD